MKLTNFTRDRIIAAAIKDAFDKRDEALSKREDAIARKAYKAVFAPDILKKVSTIPDQWFRMDGCLQFNVNGQRIRLFLTKDEKLKTPHDNNCGLLGVLTDGIADEVLSFANEKEKAREDRNAAERKLKSLLYSITTMKRLRELWPEGEKFYKSYDEDATIKGGLPALRFDDVNALLGIAEKEAA